MLRKLLSILFLFAFTFSLQAKPPDDLKNFYFPYQNFFKAKIYKYIDKNNAENIQYWYMQTKIVNNDTILTTKVYDKHLKYIELFQEKIDTQGSVMIAFEMINNRSNFKTKAIDSLVYNWSLHKEKEITWSVHFQSNYGYETFSKTRSFVSIAENKLFKNKSFQTIKFKDYYVNTLKNNQENDSYRFYQYSYYCKNLGMIEYERFIPNEDTIHFYLDEILTLKQWKRLLTKN